MSNIKIILPWPLFLLKFLEQMDAPKVQAKLIYFEVPASQVLKNQVSNQSLKMKLKNEHQNGGSDTCKRQPY